jgi:cation transport ATPase
MLTALSVLVVACPCAVGLAAPMAHSLGIGQLARHGCLVRSPGALEALAGTRLIAFDKTGTLTLGRPHLVDLASDGVGEDEVLARLAGLERHSEHGLARAIALAATRAGSIRSPPRMCRSCPGAACAAWSMASRRGRQCGFDVRAGLAIAAGAVRARRGWHRRPFGGVRRLERECSRRARPRRAVV